MSRLTLAVVAALVCSLFSAVCVDACGSATASSDGKTRAVPSVSVSVSLTMCRDDASKAVVYDATKRLYTRTAAKMGWADSPYRVDVAPGWIMCNGFATAKKAD